MPTATDQVFHFLKVTVDGAEVTVTPTDSHGNVFDEQTYTLPARPPPPPLDTEDPTTPQGLKAKASSNRVDLSWRASTDNVGVAAYEIFRNGSLHTTTRERQRATATPRWHPTPPTPTRCARSTPPATRRRSATRTP